MRFTAAKTFILDALFPKFCLGCGKEGSFLCAVCQAGLIFSSPSCPICSQRNFDGVLCPSCQEKSGLRRFLAPFSYRRELVRDLIHTYKYEGVREIKDALAGEILKFLRFYGIKVPAAVFVPVPLHSSREAERGFNQAGLLAEKLGQELGGRVAGALKRVRRTVEQIEIDSYDKRRENVSGAFRVRAEVPVRGQTVILVDDVSTSGATIFECARVLRQAGARTVWAIVVAKG